jgi:hypothetical protein
MRIFRGRRGFVIIAVAVLLLATPALAAPKPGGGEIGFDIGFTEFDSDYPSSGTVRFDVRAGWQASRLFQLEGQLGVADDSDVDLTTGFLNAVFNFYKRDRTVPYILFGVGGARSDFGSADDTAVAGQFAAGVRAYGREGKMGIRLEMSTMWEDTFEQGWTHVNLVGGLTFDLSKRHRHDPPKHRKRFSAGGF